MDKTYLPYWSFLKTLISARAQRRSDPVVCASGEVTHEYLDLKGLFTKGSLMKALATCMWEYRIALGIRVPMAIGGPTMGADMISHAWACTYMVEWFSVRDKRKDHGLRKWIEGYQPYAGHTVIITDDVVSTGGSLLKAANVVGASHAEILAVMPIVDRGNGNAWKFRPTDYHPLFTHEELGLDPLD